MKKLAKAQFGTVVKKPIIKPIGPQNPPFKAQFGTVVKKPIIKPIGPQNPPFSINNITKEEAIPKYEKYLKDRVPKEPVDDKTGKNIKKNHKRGIPKKQKGGTKTKTIKAGGIYPGAKGSITTTKTNNKGQVTGSKTREISQARANKMINKRRG